MKLSSQVLNVQINIKCQVSIILSLSILTDHKYVLIANQMPDNILHLFRCLRSPLETRLPLLTLQLYLLNHLLDDFALPHVLLAGPLELPHYLDDHNGELAELVERYLDLLPSCSFICLSVLMLLLIR